MSETHNHGSDPRHWGRALAIGIGLNVAFVIVEIAYGFSADSSALLADAGHNASDVIGLVLAWVAIWIATRRPSGKYTYGLRRTTILASLLNALLILAAAGFIAWDAVGRIGEPHNVDSMTIVIVAGIGVVINTITVLMFIRGQKEDLNIRGAFLHMAADAAVSLGVVFVGLIIRYTGANWVDPVVSIVIVAVIIYGTLGLLRDSVDLALDAVPKSIDLNQIRSYLEGLSGIQEVHDLHVWGLSTTETALTAHLFASGGEGDKLIARVRHELHERFGIDHTTLQVEPACGEKECHNGCCN